MEDRTIIEDKKYYNLIYRLNECRVDIHKEIAPPEFVLKLNINDEVFDFGSKGDFTLLTGKAKSRKTFAITMLVANYLKDEREKKVLYFDTEQSEYYVQKAVKRISILNGFTSENILAYHLRAKTPLERLEMIELAIYDNEEVGLVIIDGVRDLVTSINDEQQATSISSKLLRWTQDLKIHLITVLHQNKADTSSRGHLGTELNNKAETVFSVTVDNNDEENSIFESVFSKNKSIKPFAFFINENGVPVQKTDWTKTSKEKNSTFRKSLPSEVGVPTYIEILTKCFESKPQLRYTELQNGIIEAMAKICGVNDFSIQRSKNTITFLLDGGMLEKIGKEKSPTAFYINKSQNFKELDKSIFSN